MAPVPLLLKLPLPLRMVSPKWWQARALIRRKLEMDDSYLQQERDKRVSDFCDAAVQKIIPAVKSSDTKRTIDRIKKIFYSTPRKISPKGPDRYIKMIYYRYYHIITPKEMLTAIYPEKIVLYFQGQSLFGRLSFLTGGAALKDKLN